MKKITLTTLVLMLIIHASAQVPQALNYQAIARNSLGQIIPSQSIGVRFTISDVTGNVVYYQETHNTTTNNFGLFTLAIGKGTAVSGTIATIDWSIGGDKFLKVEIAPQGGTNYTLQGLTQLLSVPYALYAEKTKLIGGNAITITNGNTISANYQAGNAITITGNTIAANYQAGTAINITGNTISGNYQAGPGINITGSTISTTAGNSWLLNGNTGTIASNFLGTIDNQNLRFRTFNQERMVLDANGNAGIGTSAPNYLLSLEGQFNSSGTFDKRMLLSLNNTSSTNDAVAGIRFEANGGAINPANFGVISMNSPQYNVVSALSNSLNVVSFTRRGLNLIAGPTGADAAFGKIKFFIGTDGSNQNIERMRIDSTGFVGINTQTPSATLHTNGTLRFEGLNANNALTNVLVTDANGNVARRDANTLAGGDWSLTGNNGVVASNFLGTINNENLRFRTLNQERMVIDINGNAGIGTLTPNYLLSLQGQFNSSGAFDKRMLISLNNTSNSNDAVTGIRFEANGGTTNPANFGVISMNSPQYNVIPGLSNSLNMVSFTRPGLNLVAGPAAVNDAAFGKIKFFIGTNVSNQNIERMRIDSTGFVGINTQTPSAILHTNGTLRFEGLTTNNALTNVLVTDANGNVSRRDASTLTGGSNDWSIIGNNGTAASNFLGTIDNQNLRFRTLNQERMILDVNGNVGIGVSSPNYVLSIQSQGNSFGTVDRRILLSLNNTSSSNDAVTAIRFEANAGATNPTNFGTISMNSPNYNIIPALSNSLNVVSFTRPGLNLIAGPAGGNDANFGKIKFFIGTNGSNQNIERMRIDSNGFVGLNTQTPSALLHTNGTVRFENLPGGSGNILVIDNNGNVFRATQTASRIHPDNQLIESLQNELNQTKKELAQIKQLISNSQKTTNPSNKQLNGESSDVYFETINSGVIMKSPNGQCWRMTVSDKGMPVFTAINCP